jgi:hypothetical protein
MTVSSCARNACPIDSSSNTYCSDEDDDITGIPSTGQRVNTRTIRRRIVMELDIYIEACILSRQLAGVRVQ